MFIAQRLNLLISNLIESDYSVNRREFDLWRAMAAGSQAQGSWQNRKGDQAEYDVRLELVAQLQRSGLIEDDYFANVFARVLELRLRDGRQLKMASEPDVLIHAYDRLESAIEVKGGIDKAGVLERVGAAIKSLRRVKEEDPTAITILVVSQVSITPQARNDIESNKQIVNAWFSIEDILRESEARNRFYQLLGLT